MSIGNKNIKISAFYGTGLGLTQLTHTYYASNFFGDIHIPLIGSGVPFLFSYLASVHVFLFSFSFCYLVVSRIKTSTRNHGEFIRGNLIASTLLMIPLFLTQLFFGSSVSKITLGLITIVVAFGMKYSYHRRVSLRRMLAWVSFIVGLLTSCGWYYLSWASDQGHLSYPYFIPAIHWLINSIYISIVGLGFLTVLPTVHR